MFACYVYISYVFAKLPRKVVILQKSLAKHEFHLSITSAECDVTVSALIDICQNEVTSARMASANQAFDVTLCDSMQRAVKM